MTKPRKITMLVTVTARPDIPVADIRSEVRGSITAFLSQGDNERRITVRSVRPIPRGSDIARTKYRPRQGIPPLLEAMGVLK